MQDLFHRAMSASDVWKEAEAAASFLINPFPHISQILLGSPPTTSNAGRIPGSIRLFTNGGELKAVITGKEWLFDGYLVLPKEVSIIENLEKELEAGRIGWSKSAEQKNSSRKPTY